MTLTAYDERYRKFFDLFNERDFYECHEVLEDLWMEVSDESRPYYQGLIQTATAFYHLENGNFSGARKLFTSGLNYLEPYPDRYMAFDLGSYKAVCRDWLGRAKLKSQGEAVDARPEDFPLLEFPAA
jgi:predicted metal-dependent hydrolase